MYGVEQKKKKKTGGYPGKIKQSKANKFVADKITQAGKFIYDNHPGRKVIENSPASLAIKQVAKGVGRVKQDFNRQNQAIMANAMPDNDAMVAGGGDPKVDARQSGYPIQPQQPAAEPATAASVSEGIMPEATQDANTTLAQVPAAAGVERKPGAKPLSADLSQKYGLGGMNGMVVKRGANGNPDHIIFNQKARQAPNRVVHNEDFKPSPDYGWNKQSGKPGENGVLFTRENSPGMGWKQRTQLNRQVLANQASAASDAAGIEKERMGVEGTLENTKLSGENTLANTELTGRFGIEEAGMDNATEMQKAKMSEAVANRNADIEERSVDSQIEERRFGMEVDKVQADQDRMILDLQNQYLNEKDPVKKKDLADRLYAIQGKKQSQYQVVTEKGTDELGNVVNKPYLVDASGNVKPVSTLGALPQDPAQRKVGWYNHPKTGEPIFWDGSQAVGN